MQEQDLISLWKRLISVEFANLDINDNDTKLAHEEVEKRLSQGNFCVVEACPEQSMQETKKGLPWLAFFQKLQSIGRDVNSRGGNRLSGQALNTCKKLSTN